MANEDTSLRQELIQRFAAVQNMSVEEAEQIVGAPTDEEVLTNITNYTVNKINGQLNRKGRRALKKKQGKKNKGNRKVEDDASLVTDTAKKLNYIDLITKLRELNELKMREEEENETIED